MDDQAHSHPKMLAAGDRALGAWVFMGSWCGAYADDTAIVPVPVALRFGTRKSLARLVEVGLLEIVPDGYRMVGARFMRKGRAPRPWRRHRRRVLARDGGACRYCGATEDLTLDHVIPKSRRGAHDPANLVTACRSCNSKKGARTPDEAGMHVEGGAL